MCPQHRFRDHVRHASNDYPFTPGKPSTVIGGVPSLDLTVIRRVNSAVTNILKVDMTVAVRGRGIAGLLPEFRVWVCLREGAPRVLQSLDTRLRSLGAYISSYAHRFRIAQDRAIEAGAENEEDPDDLAPQVAQHAHDPQLGRGDQEQALGVPGFQRRALSSPLHDSPYWGRQDWVLGLWRT